MGLPGLSTRVGSLAFCWVSAWIRPSDAIEFSKKSTNDMVIELNRRSFLTFVVLFILKQCFCINASKSGILMYKRISSIFISHNHLYYNVNTHKPNSFNTNRLLTFNELIRQIIVFLPFYSFKWIRMHRSEDKSKNYYHLILRKQSNLFEHVSNRNTLIIIFVILAIIFFFLIQEKLFKIILRLES